jgi:type VI secretion system secreted protein Hcp
MVTSRLKAMRKGINCEPLQWGVDRVIHTPMGSSQEREASAPSISEVTISKLMDVASAKLFQEACVGKSKAVKIDLVKTGEKLENYLEYTLTDCLISGYSVSSGGDKPSESLSLNFTKIEMKYTPYDNKHQPQSPIPAGYDISLGKKL